MTDTKLHILLADDNKSEHTFFSHSLNLIDETISLISIFGGLPLMNYLNDPLNSLPDILFLDINMPVKNGKECLSDLRSDDRFNDMPIVMYSTSDAQKDTDDAFALGADLYVRKPVEIDQLVTLIRAVLTLYSGNQLRHTPRERFVVVLPGDR